MSLSDELRIRGDWIPRCAAELSALIPFYAPALYSNVSRAELWGWARGLWDGSFALSPEVAAQRALASLSTPFERQISAMRADVSDSPQGSPDHG